MRFHVVRFLMILSLLSCSSPTRDSKSAVGHPSGAADSGEVRRERSQSVKDDLNERLRQDRWLERQKETDDLALLLNMIKQSSEPPHLVRERFNFLTQKWRGRFRDKIQKVREEFSQQEAREREQSVNALKARRDEFYKTERDTKATRGFLAGQEKERLKMFAEERERRMKFEAVVRSETQDFEGYLRDRQIEFNEQFRLYSKKVSEKPKESKAVTGEADEMTEFEKLREMPAEILGTD